MSSTTTGTTTGAPATEETSQLIASDKVEGTAVYNRNGDRLGSVYNFMVNKRSGHVAYAVMSFGGFLGIGSSYHPLPWNELTYDTSLGGYVVNRTREQLEGAPAYSASELQSWDDAVYSGRVDDYYNGLGGGRMAQPKPYDGARPVKAGRAAFSRNNNPGRPRFGGTHNVI